MDQRWMREELVKFERLCDEYRARVGTNGVNVMEEKEKLVGRMTTALPVVREILQRLEPTLVGQLDLSRVEDSRQAVQFGIGEFDARQLALKAPPMLADQLHPRVWAAASVLWGTAQYRVAVGQAAVTLSAFIARKAGSQLNDRQLVAQVFSPDPPKRGQPRLHLPSDASSATWKSRQDELHLLAQGAFAGIRNIAAHTDDEWSEQVALEQLAVLSVIARWADETKRVAEG